MLKNLPDHWSGGQRSTIPCKGGELVIEAKAPNKSSLSSVMRMIGHQGDFLAGRDADSKPALWAPRKLNWFAIQFLAYCVVFM
jgi:hypothetical protein